MLDLKKLLEKILNCMYTTGTENGWFWRKYVDGTFDMWRTYTGAPTTGSHYVLIGGWAGYYVEGISLPSGCLPVSTQYQVCSTWEIGAGFSLTSDTAVGQSLTGFNLYVLSTASSQSTITVHIYVHGYWK